MGDSGVTGRRLALDSGNFRKRESGIAHLSMPSSPVAAPANSMRTLLLMNDPLLCRRAAPTLKLAGLHSVAPDAAAALRWLERDPEIGVLVIQGLAKESSTAEFIVAARCHSRRPLAVVLLVFDTLISAIRDVARLDGVEIVVLPGSDAELIAAARNAAQWCANARQAESQRHLTLSFLSTLQDQAGKLLGQVSQGTPCTVPTQSVVVSTPDSLARVPGPRGTLTTGTAVGPGTIKALLRLQSLQQAAFGEGVIDATAWVMLLDLLLSRINGKRLGVTALCIGAGVPLTTALRRIDQLVASGLAERHADPMDGRRSYVAITDKGDECVRVYVEILREELQTPDVG